MLVGRKNQLEDVTLGSWESWWAFFILFFDSLLTLLEVGVTESLILQHSIHFKTKDTLWNTPKRQIMFGFTALWCQCDSLSHTLTATCPRSFIHPSITWIHHVVFADLLRAPACCIRNIYIQSRGIDNCTARGSSTIYFHIDVVSILDFGGLIDDETSLAAAVLKLGTSTLKVQDWNRNILLLLATMLAHVSSVWVQVRCFLCNPDRQQSKAQTHTHTPEKRWCTHTSRDISAERWTYWSDRAVVLCIFTCDGGADCKYIDYSCERALEGNAWRVFFVCVCVCVVFPPASTWAASKLTFSYMSPPRNRWRAPWASGDVGECRGPLASHHAARASEIEQEKAGTPGMVARS